jgi:uncharacterized protein YqjF (DUF2071 family)
LETQADNKFLTAKWLNLVMINFLVDPSVLAPHTPHGTEIDQWNGNTYVSIVGFHFVNTKVKNLSIPFHRNFEEINLRFYVRRKDKQGWRRGVVFIKEIVPKPAIAFVAKVFYNENYVSMNTRHSIDMSPNSTNRHVRYEWNYKGRWNSLSVVPRGNKQSLVDTTEEEFITEHYWGYSAQKSGCTVEYQVEHPRWDIWQVSNSDINIDVGAIYGKEFEDTLSKKPSSAFLAEGSEVIVYQGKKI